jgi:hypothetical protein
MGLAGHAALADAVCACTAVVNISDISTASDFTQAVAQQFVGMELFSRRFMAVSMLPKLTMALIEDMNSMPIAQRLHGSGKR